MKYGLNYDACNKGLKSVFTGYDCILVQSKLTNLRYRLLDAYLPNRMGHFITYKRVCLQSIAF